MPSILSAYAIRSRQIRPGACARRLAADSHYDIIFMTQLPVRKTNEIIMPRETLLWDISGELAEIASRGMENVMKLVLQLKPQVFSIIFI